MILRFILCAVTSWICLIPTQPQSAEVEAYWALGQLWVGIGEKDTGYCPNYGMPSGNGSPPYLIWPTASHEINPNRPFSVKHPALDIYADEGDDVWASSAGTVIWAGWSTWGGGNVVAVYHGGGWYTVYFHLSEVTVVCGQWVGAGTAVGKVGMTGASNFSHLHIELRNDNYSYLPVLN